VRVRVGPLAGIVPDSLDFCFDAIVTGTPLSRARLDIEKTLVKARCSGCGAGFEVEGTLFLCSRCGSADIEVVSGTELQVVEIEMADPQAELA